MIRPGNYRVVPNGLHDGMPSYHVLSLAGSDRVAAYGDLNHDGFYSATEKQFARHNSVTAGAILFHTGFSRPSSISCQNIRPSQVRGFTRAVGGASGSYNFTLVEV